jgi:tetratricopeptide (TPR) repeat protein
MRACQLNPNHYNVNRVMGMTYMQFGQYLSNQDEDPTAHLEKALDFLGRALEVNPADAEALLSRGETCVRAARAATDEQKREKLLKEAITDLEKVGKLNPKLRRSATRWIEEARAEQEKEKEEE